MTFMYKPSTNKYGAKRTEYNGRVYHSKYEAEIAMELDLRARSGEFTLVEPQYSIQLYTYDVDGNKLPLFKYVCDFRCTKPDGTYLLVEAKGHKTQLYNVKKKILINVWLKENTDHTFEERIK